MMDMDHPPAEEEHAEKMETDEKEETATAEEGKKKKKKKEEEPQFEALSNLSRVLPAQLKYISFPEGSRYVPVKKPTGGVLIMKDLKPEEPVELIEMKVPLGISILRHLLMKTLKKTQQQNQTKKPRLRLHSNLLPGTIKDEYKCIYYRRDGINEVKGTSGGYVSFLLISVVTFARSGSLHRNSFPL